MPVVSLIVLAAALLGGHVNTAAAQTYAAGAVTATPLPPPGVRRAPPSPSPGALSGMGPATPPGTADGTTASARAEPRPARAE